MKIRQTKSVSFAIEMVRASLPKTPTKLHLNGMWMEMNMETDGVSSRLVSLLILICGVPSRVSATCNIVSEGGEWMRGTCTISLTSDPATQWTFNCHRVGNLVEATLVKAYGSADLDWLQARAAQIVASQHFAEFEQLCPAAAQVLLSGSGTIRGTSIDAAVSEFDRFMSLSSS